MQRKAFTLVELLVVIAIIGLLSTVAVVALGSSRAAARNAKRIADTRQLVVAFNIAFDSNGGYPVPVSPTGWACMSGATCLHSWSGILANSAVDTIMIPAFLGAKPADPVGGARPIGGYIYDSNWVGGTGPSGIVFSGGTTLIYVLEGAVACPLGKRWVQSSVYTECIVAVDGRF